MRQVVGRLVAEIRLVSFLYSKLSPDIPCRWSDSGKACVGCLVKVGV
jgi:hypothetical protein